MVLWLSMILIWYSALWWESLGMRHDSFLFFWWWWVGSGTHIWGIGFPSAYDIPTYMWLETGNRGTWSNLLSRFLTPGHNRLPRTIQASDNLFPPLLCVHGHLGCKYKILHTFFMSNYGRVTIFYNLVYGRTFSLLFLCFVFLLWGCIT